MKIFLLNPPYLPNFMRNARWATVGISGSVWYPIYLSYCAALLEKYGFQVKLLDAQVDGLSRQETFQIVEEFEPALLILYFSTVSEKNDVEIGKQIHKNIGCMVVLVGPWASISPLETLKNAEGIDYLAEGEFDYTVLELAQGREASKIKGLYWKDNSSNIITNEPRLPVSADELNSFPFVTDIYRRHLNLNNYHQTGHRHPFVDLFTGRGCDWGRCTFCLWPFTINKGAGYRTRHIDNVMEELQFIQKKMPYIKEIFLQDDTLPAWRAVEFSEAALSAGIKIPWSCYSRANLDIKTLRLMKRAGCRTMHVGYESSSPEILKNICKGISPQRMLQFTRDARKVGLNIVADFITGLPGETPATIKQTVKWAIRLPVQRYTVTLPKPYPCTPLYEWLTRNKCINERGKVSYPYLTYEEIRSWNKWSLKKIYINNRFLFRMIFMPGEWGRLFRSAIFFFPYLFRKKHPYQ